MKPLKPSSDKNQRAAERQAVALPARLTWTDHRGTPRFASVMTRDLSDHGAFVECRTIVSIPVYRLVQFQLEREARSAPSVPETLRQGRILSAVYRVTPPTLSGTPQGLALRLMVDPRRLSVTTSAEAPTKALATA